MSFILLSLSLPKMPSAPLLSEKAGAPQVQLRPEQRKSLWARTKEFLSPLIVKEFNGRNRARGGGPLPESMQILAPAILYAFAFWLYFQQ
jgi:hypothetical protein